MWLPQKMWKRVDDSPSFMIQCDHKAGVVKDNFDVINQSQHNDRCGGCMHNNFVEMVEDSPVIGAVKDMEGLMRCLESDVGVIFILFGDICNINEIVAEVKSAGKIAMVHMDLIIGLSAKEIAVDFIKKYTLADGIITTKQNLVKRAKELALYTVFRFFLIDSMALENIARQLGQVQPDVIEVLPGLMPKIMKKLCALTRVPIIAGGLIGDKEDVIGMLSSGALAISSTNEKIWFS